MKIAELDERLRAVELKLSELNASIEGDQVNTSRILTEIQTEVVEINKEIKQLFYPPEGNGIISRLEKLEAKEENRKWLLRIIGAGVVGLILKTIFEYISIG